jgi:hypothetical protein
MKLEMAVHGLNVNLELDDSAYNGLEILQHVKDLVDELSAYDKVILSVVSIPNDEHSEEDYQEMSGEEHIAQAAWPFPVDGHINQDGEMIDFVEPEHAPTQQIV